MSKHWGKYTSRGIISESGRSRIRIVLSRALQRGKEFPGRGSIDLARDAPTWLSLEWAPGDNTSPLVRITSNYSVYPRSFLGLFDSGTRLVCSLDLCITGRMVEPSSRRHDLWKNFRTWSPVRIGMDYRRFE